jgi:hypothetical protein
MWCLEQGRWPDAFVALARLSDQAPTLVAAIFESGSVDDQLVLMRVAGLSWPVVEWIITGCYCEAQANLPLRKAFYLSLTREAAAGMLKRVELQSNLVMLRPPRRKNARAHTGQHEGSR